MSILSGYSFKNWIYIPSSDRNTGWDLNVTPTTSWVTCDLSSKVPSDTVAIFGLIQISPTDTYGGIILVREYGSSDTNTLRTRLLDFERDGTCAWTVTGVWQLIYAPGGKFDYCSFGGNYDPGFLRFNLWGYCTK
jgi:hypothetical protein